jgi:hypothetical protein
VASDPNGTLAMASRHVSASSQWIVDRSREAAERAHIWARSDHEGLMRNLNQVSGLVQACFERWHTSMSPESVKGGTLAAQAKRGS